MSEFLTYSKFHTRQEAKEFSNLLQAANIEFLVEHEKNPLDHIYIGEGMDPMYSVRIQQGNFEKVNELLLVQANAQLNNIDPNYYLFSFSDQELTDVLRNRNEWNTFDQALARKLLSDRNVEIANDFIQTVAEEHYSPSHVGNAWIIGQYLLSVLIPYMGIIIGLATLFAYKILRNGVKVKLYDNQTRIHGKVFLIVGIIRTLLQFFMPQFPIRL